MLEREEARQARSIRQHLGHLDVLRGEVHAGDLAAERRGDEPRRSPDPAPHVQHVAGRGDPELGAELTRRRSASDVELIDRCKVIDCDLRRRHPELIETAIDGVQQPVADVV